MTLFDFLMWGHAAGEIGDLKDQMALLRRHRHDRERKDRQRIDELEGELDRMALLAQTLAELCVDKGLITREEFERKLQARAAAPKPAKSGVPAKPTRTSRTIPPRKRL